MSNVHESGRIVVAMLGARMHYAVPRLLYEADLLELFFTDSYVGNKPCLQYVLRSIPDFVAPSGLRRWLGRNDKVLPPNKIASFEALGIWYVWARKRAKTYLETQAVFREAARRFSVAIVRKGFGKAQIIWGFSNESLELFRAAKAQGCTCLLEQTILPPELECELMRKELMRWPDWQPGLNIPEFDHAAVRRGEEEWALADFIIAGSDFVRIGLEKCGVPKSKIQVIPYGVDIDSFSPVLSRENRGGRPLRILFAGRVGLRKGVPDLLHALAQLGPSNVEARFAGEVVIDREKLKPFAQVATFLGGVPRKQMPELYRWADVFVLPSIVEGSATVTYEALLSGLPVVTTPHAGSIVRSGVDGFIVPVRDPDVLAETIGRYISAPILLAEHQAESLRGRARAGLDRYKKDLVKFVLSTALPRAQRIDPASKSK